MRYKDRRKYETYETDHSIFSGIDLGGAVVSAGAGAVIMGLMAPEALDVGVLPSALGGAALGAGVSIAAPIAVGVGRMAVALAEGVVSLITKDKEKSKRKYIEMDKSKKAHKESFLHRVKDFVSTYEELKWMGAGAIAGGIAGYFGAPYLGLTGGTLEDMVVARGVLTGVGAVAGGGAGFVTKLTTDLVLSAYYGIKDSISLARAERQWQREDLQKKGKEVAPLPIEPQYPGKVYETREVKSGATVKKARANDIPARRNSSQEL